MCALIEMLAAGKLHPRINARLPVCAENFAVLPLTASRP
jgi:hypothetical protein